MAVIQRHTETVEQLRTVRKRRFTALANATIRPTKSGPRFSTVGGGIIHGGCMNPLAGLPRSLSQEHVKTMGRSIPTNVEFFATQVADR